MHLDYQHIYTDGSKDKERVGCAVLRENDHQTMRIPDGSSVFTAEAKAIDLALDLVDNCNSHDKFIIFSDSFSVLQALNHTSSKNPQIQNILQKHHTISKYKTIVYCWIPSHIDGSDSKEATTCGGEQGAQASANVNKERGFSAQICQGP